MRLRQVMANLCPSPMRILDTSPNSAYSCMVFVVDIHWSDILNNIFPLQPSDIEPIIQAHMKTWPQDSLSVRLGPTFLRKFYSAAVADSGVFSWGIAPDEGEPPVCWCLGYTAYQRFNEELKKSMGFSLYSLTLRKAISGKLPLKQIMGHFIDPAPEDGFDCPKLQLGAFGRISGGRKSVPLLIELIRQVSLELLKFGRSCYSVTDKTNRGGGKVLIAAGYNRTREVKLSDRTVNFYEFIPPSA